jgi:hypothetical protein
LEQLSIPSGLKYTTAVVSKLTNPDTSTGNPNDPLLKLSGVLGEAL